MKVVIIIPTFNESGNVEKIIEILEKEIFPPLKSKYDMNILIADDYSTDGTEAIVKDLMKKYKNLYLNQGKKNGLGAAYVRAMSYAVEELKVDVMFEMDADMQHDPKKIPQFLEKIDEGYDMVIGNRYSDGGSIPKNWPLSRKIFSRSANMFVRFVFTKFSIHDWTGGYRALRKEVFLKEKTELKDYKGYIFQISFLHKAVRDGFKIAEVPFHFSDRTTGQSKIVPLTYMFEVFKFVVSTRLKELIMGPFGKFLVVGGLGFVINLSIYWFLAHKTNVNLVVANMIGAELAIFSNYNLNNLWTFKHNRITSFRKYLIGMTIFFLTSNIGVILWQDGSIFIGDSLFGRQYYLIYWLFGTGLLLVWNFTIYSRFIWRNK